MKFKNYFFFISIFLALLAISIISNNRNKQRNITQINIDFKDGYGKYLNPTLVNKLLIQNKGKLPWESQDELALTMLETFLEKNPYIFNAEVFQYPNGILGINVEEKKTFVRIEGESDYYLDPFGSKFPISKSFLPDVPVFEGELKYNLKTNLLRLIKILHRDPFFKKELHKIYYNSNSFFIELNSYKFKIEIGSINYIEDKIIRLKVFCAYYNKNLEELEKKYSLINLKFKNQIVGS